MFGRYEPTDLEGLLKLFTFDDESALERYARSVTIYGSDFAALINSARRGNFPLRYACHFNDRVTPHLVPTEIDRRAIAENGVGLLSLGGQKTMRKVFQLLRERQVLAGHLFYAGSEWHLFAFDQRDLREGPDNHWKHGAHIHFVNWLWPVDRDKLWDRLIQRKEKPSPSIHIRHREGTSRSVAS